MKQEDKDTLLKYLCMALPYGVKAILYEYHIDEFPYNGTYCEKVLNLGTNGSTINLLNHIEKYGVKPYLRSMTSMTDEEKKEMHNLLSPEGTAIYENGGIALPINHYGEYVSYEFMNRIIQYLLKNHFDFMGLIPKALAIEVTESNNPYKE